MKKITNTSNQMVPVELEGEGTVYINPRKSIETNKKILNYDAIKKLITVTELG